MCQCRFHGPGLWGKYGRSIFLVTCFSPCVSLAPFLACESTCIPIWDYNSRFQSSGGRMKSASQTARPSICHTKYPTSIFLSALSYPAQCTGYETPVSARFIALHAESHLTPKCRDSAMHLCFATRKKRLLILTVPGFRFSQLRLLLSSPFNTHVWHFLHVQSIYRAENISHFTFCRRYLMNGRSELVKIWSLKLFLALPLRRSHHIIFSVFLCFDGFVLFLLSVK
jgi:hypothetical protein